MHKFLYWLISSNFPLHCHIMGLKFFCTLSFQNCSVAFYLSLLMSLFLMHSTLCINCRFWLLLRAPGSGRCPWTSVTNDSKNGESVADCSPSSESIPQSETPTIELPPTLTILQKLKIIPSLLVYMIPLGLVYLFEYFINQGLVSNMKLCDV